MNVEPLQTPVEVVSTLIAFALGKRGYAFLKDYFFAEFEDRISALEDRVKKLETGA